MRLIVTLLLGLAVPMIAGCDRQKAEAPQAPAVEAEPGQGPRPQPQGRGRPGRQVQESRRRRLRPRQVQGHAGAGQSVGKLVRALHQGTADAAAAGAGAGRRGQARSDRRQPGHGAARLGRGLPRRARHRPLRRLSRCRHEADARRLASRSCRRPSSTTRRARKCGAMSATSTGPARRPLRCLPRSLGDRIEQAPEQPAVDRRQAQRDQRQPGEIAAGRAPHPGPVRRGGSRSAGPAASPAAHWSRRPARSAGNREHRRRRCRPAPARRSPPGLQRRQRLEPGLVDQQARAAA